MIVVRASCAGFCMGVSLALHKLEKAIKENIQTDNPLRICTLGPIIHNPQALALYAKQGVHCINSTSEIKSGDYILIRAHGVPKDEEIIIKKKAEIISDATCPKVKNAQLAIFKATEPGRHLLLFGEPEHPEVRGLVSYARGKTTVFQSLEELLKNNLDLSKSYVLASQTTQDMKVFENITHELSMMLTDLTILSTICDATSMRQQNALEISKKVDCMIVAGGKDSGNTRRLASIVAETGIPVFHVETVRELSHEDFSDFTIAGLTAGASTPHFLVDEIEKYLENLPVKAK